MKVQAETSPCCGAEMYKEGAEGFRCTECNIVVVAANPLEDLLFSKRRDFRSAKCSRGHKFGSHLALTDKALLQCECPTVDALGACGAALQVNYKQPPVIQSDILQ